MLTGGLNILLQTAYFFILIKTHYCCMPKNNTMLYVDCISIFFLVAVRRRKQDHIIRR